MSPTSQKNSNASDMELLLTLLIHPVYKPSLYDKFITILSHSAWQGVGTVISLLSLFVTIFLTIYIFQISQGQQTANIYTAKVVVRAGSSGHAEALNVFNEGPSMTSLLKITITFQDRVDDCGLVWSIPNTEPIPPNRVSVSNNSCTIIYRNLYPYQTIQIYPDFDTSDTSISYVGITYISISGVNVNYKGEYGDYEFR